MPITADELARAIGAEAGAALADCVGLIRHCLDQLTDQQVWRREGDDRNSIGNLILHLCGNVRQWLISGVGGATDVRDRPREFAERGPIGKAELLRQLEAVVRDASAALASIRSDQLMRKCRIQGFEVSGLGAVFSAVPHFKGHTQEIVHMTRDLLGSRYHFHWVPAGPDQGAPPTQ
jgi:hypothetical protein